MIYTMPITADNWLDAIELSVHPHQAAFVPTVALSLAKAYIQPDGTVHDPVGIYASHSQELVGFYSFMYKPFETRVCYIGGYLIDKNHQGKGYGKAAMTNYLKTVRERFPACEGVYLTVHPDNSAAVEFYSRFGFEKTGLMIGGEDAMGLTLAT